MPLKFIFPALNSSRFFEDERPTFPNSEVAILEDYRSQSIMGIDTQEAQKQQTLARPGEGTPLGNGWECSSSPFWGQNHWSDTFKGVSDIYYEPINVKPHPQLF